MKNRWEDYEITIVKAKTEKKIQVSKSSINPFSFIKYTNPGPNANTCKYKNIKFTLWASKNQNKGN